MLRHLSQLTIALLLATGLTALALLSIQNVSPVALTFLLFRSIQLPVGLLLVFSVAAGMILGSLFPLLPGGKSRSRLPSQRELDAEFDFDDLV